MSTFIVEPLTIDIIVNYIMSLPKSDREYGCAVYEVRFASHNELGQMLSQMNDDAYNYYNTVPVHAQYYRHNKPGTISDVQVAKAMRCLLYQCAVGHITETSLFKLLEYFKNSLQDDIVADHPEWDDYRWS